MFHTGDWKLDDEPIIGQLRRWNLQIWSSCYHSMNSTCFQSTQSGSEGEVRRSTKVNDHKENILVTTFASNVAVATLGEVAFYWTKIMCGRSLEKIIEVSQCLDT